MYTLTVPTLIKHVSVPSYEPILFGDQRTSSQKKKKKHKKKNTNNASEADTLVSDGPDRAFDPHRL